MPSGEGCHGLRGGGLPDRVGHVDGEEVGRRQEPVHGLEPDVVGVDVPRVRPVQGGDRGLGGVADAARFRADEGVFAVGFVPDRGDLDAVGGEALEGGELGAGLVVQLFPTPKEKRCSVSTRGGSPDGARSGRRRWRPDPRDKGARKGR